MRKGFIKYIVIDSVIMAMLGYLFYRNALISLVLILAGTPIMLLGQRKQYVKRQKEIIEGEFKDAILSLAASLRAGYSVENAFSEVYREMLNLHGTGSIMAAELKRMIKKLKLGMRVEELLEAFGEKSGIEDIKSFASVFKIAKRSGGDMVAIISQTASTIGEKFEMQREIATMLAAKRLEQRLMLLMPALILMYLSLCNPGFLDILYEGIIGRLVMTLCLIIYGIAFWLGEKIVNIDI